MLCKARWIACVGAAASAWLVGCAGTGGTGGAAAPPPGGARAVARSFAPDVKAPQVRRTGPTDSVPTAYFKDQLFNPGVQLSTAHNQVTQVVGADADFSLVSGPYPSGSGQGVGEFDLGTMPAFEMEAGYAAVWGRQPRVVTTRVAAGSMGVTNPPQHPAFAVWTDPATGQDMVVKIATVSGTVDVKVERPGGAMATLGDEQFVLTTPAGLTQPAPVPATGPVRDFYEFAKGKLQEAGLIPR